MSLKVARAHPGPSSYSAACAAAPTAIMSCDRTSADCCVDLSCLATAGGAFFQSRRKSRLSLKSDNASLVGWQQQ